jgi:hypothetical protein
MITKILACVLAIVVIALTALALCIPTIIDKKVEKDS